jgi:hypothetical protein
MKRQVLLIAAAIAVTAAWGAGPALASTTWRLQPTPNPAGTASTLNGVSCTSWNICTAVGFGDGGPLVEQQSGGTWTIQTAPDPGQHGWLEGVSCLSADDCTAFGYYTTSSGDTQTLAEYWDGTSWTVQPTPNPTSTASFSGGVCLAPDNCTAVGYYLKPGKTRPRSVTLAEHWDGTSWTVQPTPNPPNHPGQTVDGGAVLNAVSCGSATSCVAVGIYDLPQYNQAMVVEKWNGKAWFLQTLPPNSHSGLYGISCPRASRCIAVGDETTQGVAEELNGTSWTTQTLPSGLGVPLGVSCPSAASCTASGYNGIAQLDGTSWTFQPLSGPHNRTSVALNGVSCPSVTACTAVGYFDAHVGTNTLAEHGS